MLFFALRVIVKFALKQAQYNCIDANWDQKFLSQIKKPINYRFEKRNLLVFVFL